MRNRLSRLLASGETFGATPAMYAASARPNRRSSDKSEASRAREILVQASDVRGDLCGKTGAEVLLPSKRPASRAFKRHNCS